MIERREIERYRLQTPVTAKLEGVIEEEAILHLETRDISSKGAYLTSEKPVPEGVHVELDMRLKVEKLQQLLGLKKEIKLKLKGLVIRSEPDGIAVSFDKEYEISTLNN